MNYLVRQYNVSQEERSIFWEVTVSVILSKKLYMNMCPIPNGFRETHLNANRKIVDKKEILRVGTVSTRAIPKSTSDWLVKKYKRENKTLLYGRVTYITALLHHIVAIHI
jgi:hypothetical protein